MTLLNPLNVSTTTLTFTRLSTVGGGVDALGNAVQTSTAVTVEDVKVTPLGRDSADSIRQSVGVEKGGHPFKVRAQSWPAFIMGQESIVASLTYNNRPATITLSTLLEENANAKKIAPNLGQSFEGILVYS
jgi:hypothetical protein